jgi:hypothetical protein
MRMTLAGGQRLWRVLLVVATLSGAGTRGMCFMPEAPAGRRPAHDCCKTGWKAVAPTCCMEGRVVRVPAIRTARQGVPALLVVPATFLHDEDCVRLNEPNATVPNSFHSPPTNRVLRI